MSWQATTLGEVLETQARARGRAEALVTATARLGYAQLLDAARRAAGGMQDMGLAKGDHVAILNQGRVAAQGPLGELLRPGESLEDAFVRCVRP